MVAPDDDEDAAPDTLPSGKAPPARPGPADGAVGEEREEELYPDG